MGWVSKAAMTASIAGLIVGGEEGAGVWAAAESTSARVKAAEQGLARRVFHIPLGRAHIAVAVADLAALDIEAVDHAVAAEPVVVAARLELGVGAVAIEGAGDLRRNPADDVQVEVILAAYGREIARQIGVDAL